MTDLDWNASQARLESVTDDPAALAAFAEVRRTRDFNDQFLGFMHRNGISFDWLMFGDGATFRPDVA